MLAGSGRQCGKLLSFGADPTNPNTWTGIERADRTVVSDALADGRLAPEVMLTGVFCGCVPKLAAEKNHGVSRAALEGMYCLRCDLVVRQDGRWLALEVKPSLTHEAIGQAVAYRHLLPECYLELAGCIGGVLCEVARTEMCGVAREGANLVVLCDEEFDEAHGVAVQKGAGA